MARDVVGLSLRVARGHRYDVWLGNNRCIHEKGHTTMKPHEAQYWEWGLDELGLFDFPAFVDHVTKYLLLFFILYFCSFVLYSFLLLFIHLFIFFELFCCF